jgi:hypothetical protein
MLSAEINWLLGTEAEQRRGRMKNEVLSREGPASANTAVAHRDGASCNDHTAVFFDDALVRLASLPQRAGGARGVAAAGAYVENGLVPRGPREPGQAFSVMPARYM